MEFYIPILKDKEYSPVSAEGMFIIRRSISGITFRKVVEKVERTG